MSKKNGETSTFEMETRETFDKILLAISGLRQDIVPRLDKLEVGQTEIRKEQTEIRKEFAEIRKEQTEIRKEFAEFKCVQAQQQKEFREYKDFSEVQFEAIRQGLVSNSNQMHRLVADIAENRAEIFSTKAMLGELNERFFLFARSLEPLVKK